MKFAALIKKEFRESLPWVLLASFLYLMISVLLIKMVSTSGGPYYHRYTPGEEINQWSLIVRCPISPAAGWLTVLVLALGVIIGVRQFWIPTFSREWGFLLHRSVSRSSVLFAKLIVAAVSVFGCFGLVWTAVYLYSKSPGLFISPPGLRIYFEGLIWVALGYVVYLGTAVSGVSMAKYYTTKLFGLAFAFFVFFVIPNQSSVLSAFLIISIAVVIILLHLVHAFTIREF